MYKTDMTKKKESSTKQELDLVEYLDGLFQEKSNGKTSTKFVLNQSQLNGLKKVKVLQDDTLKRIAGSDLMSRVHLLDPDYRNLLRLALTSEGCSSTVRKYLLKFAVLVISRNWYKKDTQCDNVFEKFNENKRLNEQSALSSVLDTMRKEYNKYIDDNKKETDKKDKKTTENAHQLLTVDQLRRQLSNILIVCCLWADEVEQFEDRGIDELERLILPVSNNSSRKLLASSVRYLIAASYYQPTKKQVSSTIRYYKEQLQSAQLQQEKIESEKAALLEKIEQLRVRNQALETSQSQQVEKTNNLEQDIIQFINEAKEKDLSEQAKRVHLKDDTITAKAKAYNLLAEDIEPPLQLSLKALLRDNPKVESAVYQIELALESIEKELSWFNK
ncbi:MAG: hypothetical protein J0665_06430 [Deltaproteobacteria bacterium]|nr:hypothetical protein [Deltaproteobacteria bacterium]